MGDSVVWFAGLAPAQNVRRARWVSLAVSRALSVTLLCLMPLARAAASDAAAGDEDQNQGGLAAPRLEEITVTARKRSESLLDVPASITALSANTIEQAHLTQIDDLGSHVSNLNIFEAHDNSPAVTLRGVGAFELVQGVGFYVNDVQLFEGQIIRPVDIARIEVLKGPQGTLYGGANVGGAIKYVTKDPGDQWDGEAGVEVGQYTTRNYHAVLSGPLMADGKLGIRASLYDDNHGGYIYDTFRQINLGDSHDRGGRITILAEPDTNTRIHWYLSADDLNSTNQNLQYLTDNDHTYKYTVEDFFYPSFRRRLWSTTLQVDHQFEGNFAFTSLSSYFASYNRGVTDFAKKPIPLDLLQQNLDQRVYTQELRLASTGSSSLDWIVGLFFEHHRNEPLTIDNFSTGDPSNPIIVSSATDRQRKLQRRGAVFADVTYHAGNWQFELGAREEHYTSANQAYNDSLVPPLSGYAQFTGNEFTPRVSVQYKLSPTLNLYSTVARGFQPGDEIEENGVIHPLKPEVATSYEAGVKSVLADSILVDAALFYIKYDNRWYQSLKDFNGGLLDVTSNIGTSRNYGAEFEVTAPLAYGFKVNGGFGVTRAVWDDVQFIDPGTSQTINLKGRTAPYSPLYSGNLSLDWEHHLANSLRVGARVDSSFVGRSYWDPQNSASQNAYQLLNLGARLETDVWSVSAHVTNVTGTQYNSMYFPKVDVGSPSDFARIGRPRWWVLTATVRF